MRDHGRERGRGRGGNYRGGGGRGGGRQYRARRENYDNRGRGGFDGGQQEHDAPRRMFQRGFIAPPPEEESPRKKLLQLLSSLGHVPAVTDGMTEDATRAAESMVEQQVMEAYQMVTHILNEQPISTVLEAFWDILLAKPHRVPYFAVLVSLLNNTSVEASEAISMDCGRRLTSALEQKTKATPGKSLSHNAVAKTVLRFECSLAALGVLSASSVLKQLIALVNQALTLVKAENGDAAHACACQPYADFLVEAVLLALPWGGASLWDADSAASDALLKLVQEYLATRPRKGFPELSPWLQMTPDATLPIESPDFVPQLFAAVQELKASGWVANCVPKPQTHVDNAFNSGAVFEAPQATAPTTPPSPPGNTPSSGKGVAASAYTPLYPPRGLWPVLPPHLDRAPEDTNAMDVIIAQEYYMHVLQAYASNGKACVDELTAGLPVPFASVSLLVELLISQMLLPAPPLMVFAYQSMLVRLVEVVGQPVARAFGGCMKTLFEAATCMDIIQLHRVADLLALFVSNNNYQWPWARWDRVLDASPLNAQRRFCSLTLAKMIRLCANLAYIQQHILPQDDRWLSLIPPSDQPTAPPPDPGNPGGLLQPYEDIMQGLMEKISDESMEEQLRLCAEQSEGSLRGVLGYFMRTLLFRARMSPFHTETLLNRYRETLKNIMAWVQEQGGEGESPELVLLNATEAVWRCSSQRATLTICRLVSDGFVTVPDVLQWAFASAHASEGIEAASGAAGTVVPRMVAEDEMTATIALETVLSLFVTLIDQAEACSEKADELTAQLPKLHAEATKAEQDMVSAQQQSEDAEITDEGREALLERIQALTTTESEVKQSLLEAEQAMEESTNKLQTLRQDTQRALESAMQHFLSSAENLPAPAEEEGAAATHKYLMLNSLASFARHVLALASGTVDVQGAVTKAQEQCGGGSADVQHALSLVLPRLA